MSKFLKKMFENYHFKEESVEYAEEIIVKMWIESRWNNWRSIVNYFKRNISLNGCEDKEKKIQFLT